MFEEADLEKAPKIWGSIRGNIDENTMETWRPMKSEHIIKAYQSFNIEFNRHLLMTKQTSFQKNVK